MKNIDQNKDSVERLHKELSLAVRARSKEREEFVIWPGPQVRCQVVSF